MPASAGMTMYQLVVAPVDALTSPQVLGPARWHNHRWRLAAGRRKLRKVRAEGLRGNHRINCGRAAGLSAHARRTPSHPRRSLLGAAKFRRAKKCEVSRDAAHFAAGMTFACRVRSSPPEAGERPRHRLSSRTVGAWVPGNVPHHAAQQGHRTRPERHATGSIGRQTSGHPPGAFPRCAAGRFAKIGGKLRRLSRIVHVAPRRRP